VTTHRSPATRVLSANRLSAAATFCQSFAPNRTIRYRAIYGLRPPAQRIADFRREIEGIQERNKIYRAKKHHAYQDQVAKERRKIRLEEIIRQLEALRPKQDSP
jgi:hypothetical protein